MEYLSVGEIRKKFDLLHKACAELMAHKPVVGRPQSRQWLFFLSCFDRLFAETVPEFDHLPPVQAAQYKFEVEDKLRRYYLRPGEAVSYVFLLVHQKNLASYEVDEEYPSVAGYCLLIREVFAGETDILDERDPARVKSYIESVVGNCIDAEFFAYRALPTIEKDELNKWFFPDSPALKEIIGVLSKHRERGWIINNLNNPSTKRLQSIKVKSIDKNEAVVATSEYWYLKWWDTKKNKYVYPYRETNRQQYILLKTDDGWKVYQNLRPSPRTSIPLRWSRRGR